MLQLEGGDNIESTKCVLVYQFRENGLIIFSIMLDVIPQINKGSLTDQMLIMTLGNTWSKY